MVDFTADVRMMAEQRGAMQDSVEDFLDDLEEVRHRWGAEEDRGW